jgi:LacI family transcriptional regulator, repressor for deo operon, udp, cdd, tsx, nupC, and nupG
MTDEPLSPPRRTRSAAAPRSTGVTIDAVARHANVSVATVSRALRGMPHVSDATRQRVQQSAEELEYHADPHASRLARGRTETIAVAVPTLRSWYASQVAAGIEAVVAERHYDLLILTIDSGSARRRMMSAGASLRKRVDGVILVDIILSRAEAAAFAATGVRAVTLGQQTVPFASVSIDNRAGAREVTRHLLATGRDRVAVIGADQEGPLTQRVSKLRFQGYADALGEAGLRMKRTLVRQGNYRVDSGYVAMRDLLTLPSTPTAVFAFSDEMAIGAMHALAHAGVRVPEDVAVAGFDGHELAESVGLTTMVQDPLAQGIAAAELLMAGEAAPSHRVLPIALAARRSTMGGEPS